MHIKLQELNNLKIKYNKRKKKKNSSNKIYNKITKNYHNSYNNNKCKK